MIPGMIALGKKPGNSFYSQEYGADGHHYKQYFEHHEECECAQSCSQRQDREAGQYECELMSHCIFLIK